MQKPHCSPCRLHRRAARLGKSSRSFPYSFKKLSSFSGVTTVAQDASTLNHWVYEHATSQAGFNRIYVLTSILTGSGFQRFRFFKPESNSIHQGYRMKKYFFPTMLCALTLSATAQDSEVNIICSQQAAWCNLMQTEFTKATGIKANLVAKSAGEALAQIVAERANPKTDVWFGGTGDPHLLAAEQNLTLSYKSAILPQLHDWAQKQAERSDYKTVGLYSGALGWGYNSELLAKKKLPVPLTWADLLKPEYKGEIQVADPRASGTAYTMIATLVQIMGEDKAFEYMTALHKNISTYPRSGAGPIKAASRGEATIGIVFLPDAITEKTANFPIVPITPTDGTGAEIGSMSIIKGARNLASAEKFYDWALSPAAQKFGPAAKYYGLPSNKTTPLDTHIPDFKSLNLIDYDYAKYGSATVRRQLILKWERTVFNQSK